MPFTDKYGNRIEVDTAQEYLSLVLDGCLLMNWRRGQYAFNVLLDYRPDLSEKIRGTPLDPFFKEELPKEFIEWINKNW